MVIRMIMIVDQLSSNINSVIIRDGQNMHFSRPKYAHKYATKREKYATKYATILLNEKAGKVS